MHWNAGNAVIGEKREPGGVDYVIVSFLSGLHLALYAGFDLEQT
jgi:hypothetical protein